MISIRRFRRPRGASLGLAAACCASFGAACDIPTDVPIVEQRWVLPLEAVTLEQSELLPEDVTIVGSVYDVMVDPFTVTGDLSDVCPICVPQPVPVPIPPFSGSFSAVGDFPPDVLEVDVESGQFTVQIDNQLEFDPLAEGGSVTILISGTGGGPTLATLTLESPTDALPPGEVTTRMVAMAGGVVAGGFEAQVDIVSSGASSATVEADDEITVTVLTQALRVNSATITVDGLSATLTEQELDVGDLDEDIADGVLEGTIELGVSNPFGIAFDGTVQIAGIVRDVSIPTDPTSTVLLQFTGSELRSILTAEDGTLSGSGTISGGPATVSPSTQLTIDPTIDVTLELGR
jgi:hypothetical protein